jgi:hypothetical protein
VEFAKAWDALKFGGLDIAVSAEGAIKAIKGILADAVDGSDVATTRINNAGQALKDFNYTALGGPEPGRECGIRRSAPVAIMIVAAVACGAGKKDMLLTFAANLA